MTLFIATHPPSFTFRKKSDLSFSWYWRRPMADTAGAAVRIGDAMFGLAAVARTLPAWAGTAAATLLNMVEDCVCGGVRWLVIPIDVLRLVFEMWSRGCRW